MNLLRNASLKTDTANERDYAYLRGKASPSSWKREHSLQPRLGRLKRLLSQFATLWEQNMECLTFEPPLFRTVLIVLHYFRLAARTAQF